MRRKTRHEGKLKRAVGTSQVWLLKVMARLLGDSTLLLVVGLSWSMRAEAIR